MIHIVEEGTVEITKKTDRKGMSVQVEEVVDRDPELSKIYYDNEMYYKNQVTNHYISIWGREYESFTWNDGPYSELGNDFCVLEFPPHDSRTMWTYSTCCMSTPKEGDPIELHLFSPDKDESMVELLTVLAHFHQFGEKLNVWHTVNFGKPWKPDSLCSYGLISLPYLDGPNLELFKLDDEKIIHFYWLIPITKAELIFKQKSGIENLEEIFERKAFNYIDPLRKSVV